MPALRRILAIAALTVCMPASARGEQRVQISGGVDGTGQHYQWTVVNRHTSPIISVEFPHYQADTFLTPAGWKQKCTHLAVVGSENLPGECRGYVEPPTQGIAPGSSSSFGMRLARISTQKGHGRVTVQFADGTQAQVSDVVLPVAPGFWDRFLIPIAMGVIFLGAFLLHGWRKRRRDAARADEPLEPT